MSSLRDGILWSWEKTHLERIWETKATLRIYKQEYKLLGSTPCFFHREITKCLRVVIPSNSNGGSHFASFSWLPSRGVIYATVRSTRSSHGPWVQTWTPPPLVITRPRPSAGNVISRCLSFSLATWEWQQLICNMGVVIVPASQGGCEAQSWEEMPWHIVSFSHV